jgi:hypothetical protein
MDVSAADPPGGAGLRWLRAHLRAIAIVAGLVLLYTLGGFLLLPHLVRQQAIDYVQRDLGRKLAIGSLSFNPYSLQIEIHDLALREADDAPIASLALLRVRFSAIASLLHRAWSFAEVRLEQPVVQVLVYADGSLNLAKLAPPSAPKPASGSNALPALRLAAFSVIGGQVHYEDRSRGQPFKATLTPIEFALTDFRTQPEFENRYQFSAATDAGEQLVWSGQFSLQPLGSSGEFSIKALKVATIASYLEGSLPFAMNSGSIDLNGHYSLIASGETALSLTLPSIQLHTLAIGPRAAAPAAAGDAAAADAVSWIALPELDVADTTLDLSQRRLGVGRVTLQNPALQIWREADGSLNLQRLLAAPASGTSTAASSPWKITLARLAIEGASIATEDRSATPAVQLKVAPLNLTLHDYSSDGVQPLTLSLDTGLGASGHLQVGGSLTLSPFGAAMSVDLKQFDLPTLQPYVAQQTDMTIYRGQLGTQLQIAYGAQRSTGSSSRHPPLLKVTGGIQVTDLATRDIPTGSDLVTWKGLQVVGLRYQMAPDALSIDQVRVLGAYGRVIIGANGELNVKQVLHPAGSAPAAASAAVPAAPAGARQATTTPAATGMPIRIKRVDISDATADFTDHSVEPNFSAAILGLNGAVVGLSSDPASRAQVSLTGSVDRYAPVSIKGELSPFAPFVYTDLALSFHNIELTTFDPYSGKFAGYSIAQGKLSTDLHYRIENRALDASHHVVIDQLEFGAATESKQAVPLPVKLAVALLKDRDGVINLELPVTGSVDDPNFKVGPIIWKVLINLLSRAVTAPFSMLGSLFGGGGGGEELAYVDFPAGSAVISDSDLQKLPRLSKALLQRPQLKLDIPLRTLSAADDQALAQAGLESALSTAAASGRGGKHAPTRLAALTALYRQGVRTDPVYPAGAADDAAKVAWLQQQLLPQFKPTTDQRDALGRARAEAAEAVLLNGQELPAERVFLTDRESGAAAGADGTVRMELKLQ